MATEYRQRPGMGDHFDDEDLVMSSAQQRRNWRGILIALMVIVAVLAMIVTSVVLLTPPQPEELSDGFTDTENGDRSGSDYYYNQRANDELWWRRRGMRTLRLSDALSDSAAIKTFNGTWISGNEVFYVTGAGDLAVMEIHSDGSIHTTRHLMYKKTLQKLKGLLVSFELSPDRNHVLIGHDAKKLYRYSKTARYTVYTVSTGQITPIMLDSHRYRNGTTSASVQPYLLHAQWHKISTSLDKNVESMALIFVYRYDVFYVPWLQQKMSSSSTVPASDVGKSNVTSPTSNGTKPHIPSPSSNQSYNVVDHNNSSLNVSLRGPWEHGQVRRITTTGFGEGSTATVGTVSNGVADYLYEMEILKRSPAIWPSSGRYMLYATFDDRRVAEYKYSVYMKGGQQHNKDNDDDKETDKSFTREQKLQRKKKRRRRRIRRYTKTEMPEDVLKEEDKSSEYYLYPKIRTIRYPKANTPNPVVTLSVIINLDQLGNPQVQPKIRTLTPPPIFQYTEDYYFTAVQWVNDGGISSGFGRHESDDDKTGASAAELCVVWLNRAQNTSVTTLCKAPMWMCQETQVINAVEAGSGAGGSDVRGASFSSDWARRRYRRNGADGSQKSSTSETTRRAMNNNNNESFAPYHDIQYRRRQAQQHQHQHQHQHNGHHSRRRRAGDHIGDHDGRWYGGWVDATVGGAGGGVPSTGGGVSGDGGNHMVSPMSSITWWTRNGDINNDHSENFASDDGYVGIADNNGAGYAAAALVRRGWETGDKELTPRAPVFAADGQGYVSVAPVRDEEFYYDPNQGQDRETEGGVRLRRPSPKQHSAQSARSKPRQSPPIGKYFAQVVAVNITKKLLAPLTFGDLDDNDDGNDYDVDGTDGHKQDKKKRNIITKSWTVVRILAWDQRTDMIYFLAIPSGRGAPHHRHLYAVKFTSVSSAATNSDSSNRAGHHHQQPHRKTIRHSTRNRPVCLSCDIGSPAIKRHKRRDLGGKQNRMDEARDDRLRQQQRERWEDEDEKIDQENTATSEERREQHNRQQQQQKMKNRGPIRHCTYYDAQFSRDGSYYALICLGPSVPYVTLHRIVVFDNDSDESVSSIDGSGVGDQIDIITHTTKKGPKDSFYSFEFMTILENNTRLQEKYTNRVLLPGTRTFQLRLSGGRKLTTSGGLHFNDPLAAADYYSNGGDHQLKFSDKKRPDSDPLTVAQVRLYLPLGVYDPEADPRPEFMQTHSSNSGGSTSKVDMTTSKTDTGTSESSSSTHTHSHHRRRRSSSSSSSHVNKENDSDGSKRQRRQRKQQRQRRYKKLYPMLVVVNSDPGSQAITDRFSDRLGYTTGLLCSGSLGRTGVGAGIPTGARYDGNEWDHRRQNGYRDRRSSSTRYYSSGHSENYDDDSRDYNQNANEDINNNEYVVAVIDTGRGTWARGYESLLALNYGDGSNGFGDYIDGDNGGSGRLLGTSDLRDQMEAVEYLLSSATTTSTSFKDNGNGYYSEDRPRGGRGGRDRSRWFSSTSQSNRRYYSDDDDYYSGDEYDEYIDKNGNEDYYYYYYSNSGENSDYGGGQRGDGDRKRSHKDRRSTSDSKSNPEALRLPYVDATRVALLGGGPTTPSSPPSIYGGYAAARMAFWQSIYGGAPIEKKSGGSGDSENLKEPVAIHSSFKCAVTMAPVYSWRLYASTFAERYYGYFGRNDGDTGISYDRSDIIPYPSVLNESSYSPSSHGKGINLLVMHGTADTTIHPQHSMMLVRGVMQQQQQWSPMSFGGLSHSNYSASGGRAGGGIPIRPGPIRISQFVLPDADLSNSKMATGIENGSPSDHHYQLLHAIYSQVTHYLASECFTSVGDGSRGVGMRVRGQRLRKRSRRRWRNGNRDSEKQNNQQRGKEHQQNDDDKSDFNTDIDNVSGDRNSGGRFRRHDVDDNQHILESQVKDGTVIVKIQADDHNFNDTFKSRNIGRDGSIIGNFSSLNYNKSRSSNTSKGRKTYDDDDVESNDEEENDDEDSNEEYDDDEKDESDEEKEDDD